MTVAEWAVGHETAIRLGGFFGVFGLPFVEAGSGYAAGSSRESGHETS